MKTLSIFKDENNFICVIESKEEYDFYQDYFRINLDGDVYITDLRDFDVLEYQYDYVDLSDSSLSLHNSSDMHKTIFEKIAEVQVTCENNLKEKALELINEHKREFPELYL